MIIKPLAQEVALSTSVGDNISLANVVRIFNNSATSGTVTIQNSGVTVATIMVAGNADLILEKDTTHTLLGSATTLRAVKIAYAN
jgi:hypothetical protein